MFGLVGISVVSVIGLLQIEFWIPILSRFQSPFLASMYIAAVLGDLFGLVMDYRSSLSNSTLFDATIGTLLALIFCLPAYVLAGLAILNKFSN